MGGMSLATFPEKNMNRAQLSAEMSPQAIPTGFMFAISWENMPLASTVPAMTMSAAATSAALGGLRVTIIWMTMPIHVNWNSSVMAAATGRYDSEIE